MQVLRVAFLIAALAVAAPASAGVLVLSFKDGRVTLKATDVSLRQVLNEWARLGQTRIVGLEKLSGSLLTLELTDVPEKQALEVLLRTVAGYVAAPRVGVSAAAMSRFDRLVLLPTSVALAAPPGGARPAAQLPRPPTPFPDPIQLANEEPESSDAASPSGVPVYNPNADPTNPPVPTAGQGTAMPGQFRPPLADDPNAQAPISDPAPVAPPPILTTRPGVIPHPSPPPPRP
jgi:hypothetical protein